MHDRQCSLFVVRCSSIVALSVFIGVHPWLWVAEGIHMKLRLIAGLVSLGGAMILSSSATAQYTGLEVVQVDEFFDNHPNTNVRNSWLATNGAYDVYRLFATFDGNTATDRVDIVYGNAPHPAYFTVITGAVYNEDRYGSSYATYNFPPPSFAGANASRAWETWATINQDVGTGGAIPAPGSFDPGQFNGLNGSWTANNAAWFITPDNPLGVPLTNWPFAPAENCVLIMQITMSAGGTAVGSQPPHLGESDVVL